MGGRAALSPAGVTQRPAELPFGPDVRGATGLGAHHHRALARDQPREPERNVAGRLGGERVREHGQPFAKGGGLVVNDVVDVGSVVFKREQGRCGGGVEVDEGGDSGVVADDRELPLAHRPDQPVVGRAVKAAVAKRDAAGSGDRLVVVAHRRVGLARPAAGAGSSGSSSVLTSPPSRAYR